MKNISELREYINRTNIPDNVYTVYSLRTPELFLLHEEYLKSADVFRIIVAAFDFGMARGWRACQTQQKKQAASRRVS